MFEDNDPAAWLELGDFIQAGWTTLGNGSDKARLVDAVSSMTDGERAVEFSQREVLPLETEGRAWMGVDLDRGAAIDLALARHVIASPKELLALSPDGGWRNGGLLGARRWMLLSPGRTETALEAARLMPEIDALILEPAIRGGRPIDLARLLAESPVTRLRCRGGINGAALDRVARAAVRLKAVDLDVEGAAAAADRWLEGDWPQLVEARFAGLRPHRAFWGKADSSPVFGRLTVLEMAWAGLVADQIDSLLRAVHGARLTTLDLSYGDDESVAAQVAVEAPSTLATLRIAGIRVDPSGLLNCIETDVGPRTIVVSASLYTEDERAMLLRACRGIPRIRFEGNLASWGPDASGVVSPWWSLHDDRRLPCDW